MFYANLVKFTLKLIPLFGTMKSKHTLHTLRKMSGYKVALAVHALCLLSCTQALQPQSLTSGGVHTLSFRGSDLTSGVDHTLSFRGADLACMLGC